ncbi:DUF2076 domain-containing protein [Azospirillum cavernae]|uniref:DUF2076 domain-containing protein n=1 Tax=Azospirillum cavernae TaxID=2320860 RepID=A0A418VT09_9PROT|nr:DUF2076 domain-containing protein [Azospirillum cavernae]RJF79613.1 DUF2076 domain-containing protein [Azospirillum cavernae]
MTPEERTLLTDLFRNLREAESQPRDADAESFIRQSAQSQPLAPYYMAQAILVQQQALGAAHTRIEDLERQLKEAQSKAAQPAPTPAASGGSFLSNALGLGRSPWGARSDAPAAAPQPTAAPARSPWAAPPQASPYGQPGYAPSPYGQQPAYPPQQGFAPQGYAPRGGGFLAGAAQTAAGVAGGMLAASAISSLFSHSSGALGGATGAAAPISETVTNETVVNNFYGEGAAPPVREVAHQQPADQQTADYQSDEGSFDGGGDSGGDDSWI